MEEGTEISPELRQYVEERKLYGMIVEWEAEYTALAKNLEEARSLARDAASDEFDIDDCMVQGGKIVPEQRVHPTTLTGDETVFTTERDWLIPVELVRQIHAEKQERERLAEEFIAKNPGLPGWES